MSDSWITSRGLVEEVMWALANLLALEEHYVDEVELRGQYVSVRLLRDEYVKWLARVSQADEKKFATYWCVIKHLLLAAVHSLEIASGMVKNNYKREDVERMLEISKFAFDMAYGVLSQARQARGGEG